MCIITYHCLLKQDPTRSFHVVTSFPTSCYRVTSVTPKESSKLVYKTSFAFTCCSLCILLTPANSSTMTPPCHKHCRCYFCNDKQVKWALKSIYFQGCKVVSFPRYAQAGVREGNKMYPTCQLNSWRQIPWTGLIQKHMPMLALALPTTYAAESHVLTYKWVMKRIIS